MKAFPRWWSTREDSLCCQRRYRNSVPHRKHAGCKSAWTLALDPNYFPKKNGGQFAAVTKLASRPARASRAHRGAEWRRGFVARFSDHCAGQFRAVDGRWMADDIGKPKC